MKLGPLYQLALLQEDSRAGMLHVSVYTALLYLWHKGYYRMPVSISRREVMRLSKIRAKATYHKTFRELQAYGYITYYPSYHPVLGSLVYFRHEPENAEVK